MPIPGDYIKKLPRIYKDILAAFPRFDSTRKAGFGLAFQSLYSALDGKYTLGQIKLACEEMARGGAMEIRNDIFAHPTALGEELIGALTEPPPSVPRFPPLRRRSRRDRISMNEQIVKNNQGRRSNVGSE